MLLYNSMDVGAAVAYSLMLGRVQQLPCFPTAPTSSMHSELFFCHFCDDDVSSPMWCGDCHMPICCMCGRTPYEGGKCGTKVHLHGMNLPLEKKRLKCRWWRKLFLCNEDQYVAL